MSVSEPNFRHLQEVLTYVFIIKKSAAEAHLSEAYGEGAMSEQTC